MTKWRDSGWTAEDLDKLELSFLKRIFGLKEPVGVDATIAFSKYLSMVGVNPDNYPVFLKLIGLRNHWVTDALIGTNRPDTFFNKIQPNYFIVQECFANLTRANRGGLYPTSLLVYFGILNAAYDNPHEGYRLYPLTAEDVNNTGKHLDETQDQRFELNAVILKILDSIASLVDAGRHEENEKIMDVVTQANNIRGKFLDMTKSLNEAIPDLLLQQEDYTELETAPSA